MLHSQEIGCYLSQNWLPEQREISQSHTSSSSLLLHKPTAILKEEQHCCVSCQFPMAPHCSIQSWHRWLDRHTVLPDVTTQGEQASAFGHQSQIWLFEWPFWWVTFCSCCWSEGSVSQGDVSSLLPGSRAKMPMLSPWPSVVLVPAMHSHKLSAWKAVQSVSEHVDAWRVIQRQSNVMSL